MSNLRERLKELRGNRSQAEIAKSLGICQSTYHGYEHGSGQPKPEMLIKMASFFNCSADYLLGLTNSKKYKSITALKILLSTQLKLKSALALCQESANLLYLIMDDISGLPLRGKHAKRNNQRRT